MAEATPAAAAGGGGGGSLKDQGNEFFKAGNYLKAAALYTQAIKKDPSNPTLYSNRAAAFLHLVKLSKALADAETTITLNSQWDKGYFRKGCVLEAMERYDDAVDAFQIALQHNPHSAEVSRKIKRLGQLASDKKRVQEVENIRSNIDMSRHLDPLKLELSEKYGADESWKDVFSFIVETMEMAIKSWHETTRVDARVYFLLDNEKTQTDKYAPVVNIDKLFIETLTENITAMLLLVKDTDYPPRKLKRILAFESPHTHSSCFSFLRQYAEESFSRAACLVAAKSIISYPQVWKGQGSRKWKHGQSDGFFVQLELPSMRKLWFVPSSTEKGQILCRNPEALDVSVHEIIPRLFKEITLNPSMD